MYIYVLATNFSNYKKEGKNGGAVHLINCGIHCNDANFIDCVSLSGAGGGMLINSTLDMTNNATFSNVLFLRCKALYGGAVFIYTDSDLFNISFDGCRFESNEALKTKPSNSKNEYLFGRSAMLIMSNGFTIYSSSFTHNKGYGSVKIYNSFMKKSMLQESQNSILIHCCDFDEEENSKGSINYIDEKSNANVDIVDCKFKGNIKKGSYYIDGKLINKEKLHVASCNFKNDINNHVNVKLTNNEIKKINQFYVQKAWL